MHRMLIWPNNILNLSPENTLSEEVNNPKILDLFTFDLNEDF